MYKENWAPGKERENRRSYNLDLNLNLNFSSVLDGVTSGGREFHVGDAAAVKTHSSLGYSCRSVRRGVFQTKRKVRLRMSIKCALFGCRTAHENSYIHCVSEKMHQLWNGTARNYKDQFYYDLSKNIQNTLE